MADHVGLNDDIYLKRAAFVLELKQLGLNDRRLLNAFEATPHEVFVPESYQDHIYRNRNLPIGCGQTLTSPHLMARMIYWLDVRADDLVLQIGTGSGYMASVLSLLCRRVYSIERYRQLAHQAESYFTRLKIGNITGLHGDGRSGWINETKFQRIIVCASVEEVPEGILNQLDVNGKLVIPVGNSTKVQDLYMISRSLEGYNRQKLADVRFTPLESGKSRSL